MLVVMLVVLLVLLVLLVCRGGGGVGGVHVCLLACVRACLSIHLLGGHGSVSSMQAFWLVVHGSGGGGG